MSLVGAIISNPLIEIAIRLLGLSLLSFAVTLTVSLFYFVRVGKPIPEGPALIIGLGAVAIYLNTRLIFIQFVGDAGDPLTVDEAVLNVGVFVAAGGATYGGRHAASRIGESDRFKQLRFHPDLSPLVRATGRYITVRLPDDASDIEDIEGYDPVQEETKEALAGQTIDFPRGLTLTELEYQLVGRLKEEHDIGYVDVELTANGTIEYIAIGQRAAGIGPTLPPRSAAVAVRADPPFSATPGDMVQIWDVSEDGTESRVGTGELRASVGQVATVAVEESVAQQIDPTRDYRLMTLAAETNPEREFAAMLRRGDETMSIFELTDESPFVGNPIGTIEATVIAIQKGSGEVETIPKRDRLLEAGDVIFVIGRPDALRKLDGATGTSKTSPPVLAAEHTSTPGATLEPDGSED